MDPEARIDGHQDSNILCKNSERYTPYMSGRVRERINSRIRQKQNREREKRERERIEDQKKVYWKPKEQFELKEPKLEEPDFEEHFPDKMPKEEGFLLKEPKVEVEEEPDSNTIKPWRPNLDFLLKEPKEEIEEKDSVLAWRPEIQSVTDFLHDDSLDFDFDLGQGTSDLFDNLPSTSTQDYDSIPDQFDNEFEETEKKTIASKAEFEESFSKNSHPRAAEMQQLAEKCNVRYKTVFDYFEEKRKKEEIQCESNDACERIKHFFSLETEPMMTFKMDEESRNILEDELEMHLLSRKRLTVGYVHAIMEKLELHPNYIRGQFENWKRKLLTKDRDIYRDRKIEQDNSHLFSIDTLRQLEEAYLQKKYHCEEKEWGPKDIKSLSDQLNLKMKDVEEWIKKRKTATLGLEHDVIEFRRDRDVRLNALYGRKLPTHKVRVLNEQFEMNDSQGMEERTKLAAELGLTELQVRNYFNKKRMSNRKKDSWESARVEFMSLPQSTKDQMEKLATQKRRPAVENMESARRIGVSYTTLVSFIDWRKSLVAAKFNKYHF